MRRINHRETGLELLAHDPGGGARRDDLSGQLLAAGLDVRLHLQALRRLDRVLRVHGSSPLVGLPVGQVAGIERLLHKPPI